MKQYIERRGYLEEVWQVWYDVHRFKHCIFVQGTEPEMHDYLESEIGYVGRYSACTDDEISAVEALRIPIYIAPKIE